MATQCEISIGIDVPAEHAFAALADFANAPKRVPGIRAVEMLTPGPVAVGTRFRETRVMFGREARETMEVTRFDPPSLYELSALSCGSRLRSTIAVTPRGDRACEVTMRLIAEAETFFAKCMMLVMGRMMLKACTKAIREDLDAVKRSLEAKR
jgi:hypothetical protein